MTVKGVKSKSESFFSISPGGLELWRKNLWGGGRNLPPPHMDRVKLYTKYLILLFYLYRALKSSKKGKIDGFCPFFIVMEYKRWSNMLTMCDI